MKLGTTLRNKRLGLEAARTRSGGAVAKNGHTSSMTCGIVSAARSLGQVTGSRIPAASDAHDMAHGHRVQASANG
jgi:hypothetical protein